MLLAEVTAWISCLTGHLSYWRPSCVTLRPLSDTLKQHCVTLRQICWHESNILLISMFSSLYNCLGNRNRCVSNRLEWAIHILSSQRSKLAAARLGGFTEQLQRNVWQSLTRGDDTTTRTDLKPGRHAVHCMYCVWVVYQSSFSCALSLNTFDTAKLKLTVNQRKFFLAQLHVIKRNSCRL